MLWELLDATASFVAAAYSVVDDDGVAAVVVVSFVDAVAYVVAVAIVMLMFLIFLLILFQLDLVVLMFLFDYDDIFASAVATVRVNTYVFDVMILIFAAADVLDAIFV